MLIMNICENEILNSQKHIYSMGLHRTRTTMYAQPLDFQEHLLTITVLAASVFSEYENVGKHNLDFQIMDLRLGVRALWD